MKKTAWPAGKRENAVETERLILRKPEPGDLDRFEKLFNTDFVTQYLCMEKLDRAEALKKYLA